MKKGFLFVILLSVFTGCVKELIEPVGRTVEHEFTACFEQDVKTSLDSEGYVSWSKNDTLSYYTAEDGAISKCVVPFDCSSFSFTATVGEHDTYIVAAYGGTISENKDSSLTLTGAIPAVQSGLFKDAHVAVCKKSFSAGKDLSFKNATSLIEFSLARTDVKYLTFTVADTTKIHGNGKLCFTFGGGDVPTAAFDKNEGGSTIRVNTDGAGTFYIATLPCMINGFSFEFFDNNDVKLGKVSTDKTLTLNTNEIVSLGEIDSRIEIPAEDLSKLGPANCYIVSSQGDYKFKTVKGNSFESVGEVKGVKVLWETFGTSTKPSVGALIKSDVSYKDGYIIFSTNDTFKEGNAVIAAYSDSGCTDGNVLWSWHIWMTDKPEDQTYNHDAGTMMDRNLGATSATKGDAGALGLMYQWGRKDPFIGGYKISYGDPVENQQKAASTLSWPSAVTSNSSIGTIAYAVAHPTIFIKKNANNQDWYYSGTSTTDNDRWQSAKTIYDPCPVGYRVPDGGASGVWSSAFGSKSAISNGPWDATHKGMDFGSGNGKSSKMQLGTSTTIWYPATGYLNGSDSWLCSVGNFGYCWSCTPEESETTYTPAYRFDFFYEGYVYPSTSYSYRARGQSVRCVKDSSAPEPKTYTDLSKDGTANCYIVSSQGDYKFKGTVKGNSTESVGTPTKAEVLWETFGTDVTPTVGDLVKDVTFSEDYVKFSATDNKGNAVIAVKDASDNILWSWHIWMTDKPKDQVYNNNAGTMMDRNLGATSAAKGDVKALGLMYQWGRKDPFLGGCQISYSSLDNQQLAASTGSWPSPVKASEHLIDNTTLSYSILNPTTYILSNNSPSDWYCIDYSKRNDYLWKNKSSPYKTIYDPCPAGYRVPDGGNSGVWSTAFGTSDYWLSSSNWDSSNKGMDFGLTDKKLGSETIWYPGTGWLSGWNGCLYTCGYNGDYRANEHKDGATEEESGAVGMGISEGGVMPSGWSNHVSGESVRCLSESSTPIVPVASVELNKYSMTLLEGNAEQLTGNVLPANANVKTLTWSSSDPNIASVSNTGLVTAVSDGTCTITATAYNGIKAECSVTVTPLTYTDLSATGTANCYIVSSQGDYKFKGTVKGNSTESVGTPTKAEVLWETFGTSTTPTVGDLVKNVTYSGGYVKFTATVNNGNAVIAVKDASDNILWSWHIWMTDKPKDQAYNNNAGTLMDRNLGATSAKKGDVKALGLLYQWGRKDPFLGSSSISSTTLAKSTINSWPEAVTSNETNGTIPYAVAHPMTFISSNENNYDWYYTGTSITDNTRWQTLDKTKGLYDPCPAGYRVPDGGENGVWSTAFGTSSYWETSSNWDSVNHGMDFGLADKKLGSGTIWYPNTGLLSFLLGSLNNVELEGDYWSCSPNGKWAYHLYFAEGGYINPSSISYYRAYGNSVRCISESSTPIVPVASVDLNKSSITLSEGDAEQLTGNVLPANANVKTLTWSSSDPNIASVSNTGLVTAISEGACAITATAYNGVKTECSVTVIPDTYTNLSATGTANCYIVSSQGDYRFKGTVKGNSTESVGTPAKAEVLWETFGTDTEPTVNDLVKNVTYSGGYVKFTATNNKGNAVIAVKDASNNILWSWHIWMTEKPEDQTYNHNAGTLMDRNLGATSATKGDAKALGLLYQWGRKDPFLGSSSISSTTLAKSTINSWPEAVTSNASTGTISYAVAHPMTFITSNENNYDWYYTGSYSTDNTRWQSIKTIYDPCPQGYLVPNGGTYGVWSTAFGTSSTWYTSSNWDPTNKGMNFGATDKTLGSGTIWYPAAGIRYYDGGSLSYVGGSGGYWSYAPTSNSAYYLFLGSDGRVSPSNSDLRAFGLSVRCVKEK